MLKLLWPMPARLMNLPLTKKKCEKYPPKIAKQNLTETCTIVTVKCELP